MKYPIKTVMIVALALASCQLARADLSSQIATSFTSGAGSNWVSDPNGQYELRINRYLAVVFGV
jgi:hypothetical protein